MGYKEHIKDETRTIEDYLKIKLHKNIFERRIAFGFAYGENKNNQFKLWS